jgi:hypothetical protein
MITRQREPGEARPGEWSHRVWSPARPPTFERPVEEREIVRRKSFAFGPMSVEDAADALEDLDHEFFLFRDADTQADAVLYWRDDGLLALIESRGAESADYGPVHEHNRLSAPIALEAALGEMNEVGHRFLFFENAASGRGNVLYRRYDGHYGLIEPVDNLATTAKDTVREAEVMCVAPDAGMAEMARRARRGRQEPRRRVRRAGRTQRSGRSDHGGRQGDQEPAAPRTRPPGGDVRTDRRRRRARGHSPTRTVSSPRAHQRSPRECRRTCLVFGAQGKLRIRQCRTTGGGPTPPVCRGLLDRS